MATKSKTKKEVQVGSTASNGGTQAKKETTQKPKVERKPSFSQQVEEVIKAAGSEGITSKQIAQELKLLDQDMEKTEQQKVLKQVRTAARKVTGGAAAARDGANAIYILSDE